MSKVSKSVCNIVLGAMLLFGTSHKVIALSSEMVIQEVNRSRATENLPLLIYEPKLASSATLKLQDIQKYHYWAHNNPITKESWWKTIWQSGFRGKVGENLARGFNSEQGIISGWLSSPSHRKNLLNKYFTKYGLAIGQVSYDGIDKELIVFHFGN